MNRTKGILAAATLTGLVLITLLALGLRSVGAGSAVGGGKEVTNPARIEIQQPVDSAATNEALESWQTYSSDLENTVQILQEREAAYQLQIEAANEAILQLQDQVNDANATINQQGAAAASYEDDEHGEHEYEEHEEYEHEDHD